jgi:uncharacterized protein (DUF779 family)
LAKEQYVIIATDAAKQALERLRNKYGEIILHVTGGWSKTPVCLQADELRLGARDILLGSVSGVKIYEMQITPEAFHQEGDYILALVAGVPVGFSLDAGNGMKFTIERRAAKQTPGADC